MTGLTPLSSLGPGLALVLAGIQNVSPGQVIRQCQWSNVRWAVCTKSQ